MKNSYKEYEKLYKFMEHVDGLSCFLDLDYCNSGNSCLNCKTSKECEGIDKIIDGFVILKRAVGAKK